MTLSLLIIFIPPSMLIFDTVPVSAIPLQSHSPIFIDGDKFFTNANGVDGGSGTLLNPYLIQNWNVTAPGGIAVDIRNTTAYFVIRNVFAGWSQYGMSFRNVTNADVENSTLFKNQYGLNLVSSSDASSSGVNSPSPLNSERPGNDPMHTRLTGLITGRRSRIQVRS